MLTNKEMVAKLKELQAAVDMRQYSWFDDTVEDLIAALESEPEPLAQFSWLLQRDDNRDWCLEWVRPGDEFDGDEEILVTVTISKREQ